MTQPGPASMRYSLDEVLSGMLASVTSDGFTDDTQKLGEVFKALSETHALLAPFAAMGGEADFSALLKGALERLVDKKMLQHEPGRYSLTVEGRAACVRSKRTLFNLRDIEQLEAAARDFDACAGK
ncbi:MAG: hypothetical protein ABIH46_07300 [Chloroflexota bacterium]